MTKSKTPAESVLRQMLESGSLTNQEYARMTKKLKKQRKAKR